MKAQQFFTQRHVVIALASLCCLLWGSAYPSIKSGYALFQIAQGDIASKMLFAGYRFVFAGLILLALGACWRRPMGGFSVADMGRIGLLGLTQTTLQYVFFYIGLAYTTGVKGSIMNATGTFFSVLLAHFIYRNDRLSANRVMGCVLGFIGVMVVNFSHDLLNFNFTLAGEGSVVLSAFILSAASIYGKHLSQRMDSLVLTGYQLTLGGVALTLGGYLGGGALIAPTLKSGMLMAYMALLSSVAFALWALLLKYNRVGMVAIFNFLIPVFGALLSAVFLDERILEWKNVFALLLVCAGIWLVTREPARAAA